MEKATITRSEWRRKHRDFKCGDPRKGTAKVLKMVEGVGTCLVPVDVVPDPPEECGLCGDDDLNGGQ